MLRAVDDSVDILYYYYYRTQNKIEDGIYSIKTDGSGEQKVIDFSVDYMSMAKDKKENDWIIYLKGAIYAVRADGSERCRITDEAVSRFEIIGDRIFYMKNTEPYKIFTIKTDGSDLRQFADFSDIAADGSAYGGSISVSGDWIIYTCSSQRFIIKNDGTGRRVLD